MADSSPATTIREFLDAALKPRSGRAGTSGIYAPTLYRGQPFQKSLLPRLFRPDDPRDLNDATRISEVIANENRLLEHFKNDSPYLLPSVPNNEWDWLSMAQHFTLPTRLLDWTANPLTALFFAVEQDSCPDPVVYAYYVGIAIETIVTQDMKRKLNPLKTKKTKVFQPSWHSVRVALQAGWHTAHAIDVRKDGRKYMRPLDEMEIHKKRLRVIPIDPGSVQDLRDSLADMGIKHASVYGDLESVCASIKRTVLS